MKRHGLASLAVVAACLLATRVDAQQLGISHTSGGIGSATGGCASGGCDTGYSGCDSCGGSLCSCDQSSLYFQYENTFFRYHRADGMRVGANEPGEQVESDFEYAPRITLGYVGPSGLGLRVRYWEYDHDNPAFNNSPPGQYLDVNTYNFDTEIFEEIAVNGCTSLELSAGIRYNDFDETLVDSGVVNMNTTFAGWGGMLGLQVNRNVCRGALFARGRVAILMDDAQVIDDDNGGVNLLDSTQGMSEIALGYRITTCVGRATLTSSIAGEWQNWYNYSSNFSSGVIDTNAAGRGDVGFGGIVLSTTVQF